MNTIRTMITAVAAFALVIGAQAAGSKGSEPRIEAEGHYGPTQAEARAAVDDFIHRSFKDPYSVRDLRVVGIIWNWLATVHIKIG